MSTEALDVVISFDTTGSMAGVLGQVRKRSKELVERLFKEIPGLHVGVMAHGDYSDAKTKYLLRKVDLTDDKQAVLKFIKSVPATFGGDSPEAYEYALHEARSLAWRDGVGRVLVVIGDEVPHGREHIGGVGLGIEWPEAIEVGSGPKRVLDHRPHARNDVDAESDRMHRRDDVGVEDGGVGAVAADRLQRDLRRQIGLRDRLQNRPGAPNRPVLGQRAAGLAHEPDGDAVVWEAPARCEERGLGQVGYGHAATLPAVLRSLCP